jgi:hypothetical protein
LLDPELFSFGLSLSHILDARFGKQTIAAKMSDVPGHTRGIIPLLAQAGVRLLHIGVNHMSATPDVPPVFRWRDVQTGAEVVTAYSHSYASDVQLPGSDCYLAFRMVGDNMEIPSIPDILDWHRALREQFPDAEIAYGTLSDFARAITDEQIAALPVLEQEIGDTWIHGVGSDPGKVARFRELARLRRQWLDSMRLRPGTRSYLDFSKNLLLIAEHTWASRQEPGCTIPPVNATSIFTVYAIWRPIAIAKHPGKSSAIIWNMPLRDCEALTCRRKRDKRWRI